MQGFFAMGMASDPECDTGLVGGLHGRTNFGKEKYGFGKNGTTE